MGQGDHSKEFVIKIKVPNPIVTFMNFQVDEAGFKKLQKEIQEVIWGAEKYELPPDYWINVRKIFTFLDSSLANITENILKYASGEEAQNLRTQFSSLETNTIQLRKSYEILLQDGVSESERNSSTAGGIAAGGEILQCFADRSGILCKKSILSAPYLVAFAGIYKAFWILWGKEDSSRRRKEMERLEDTLQCYKIQCIQERLDNIKMLRTQSESYNVHDYSYEAQVRKDVAFGGTINDFYDKRPKDKITFKEAPLTDPNDADVILTAYKESVKMEYESFFNAVLTTA